MAATVTTSLLARLQPTRKTAYDGGTRKLPVTLESALTWASGSGTSQADEMFTDALSITAAAFSNLDLTALTQTGAAAESDRTVTFANVKGLLVVNTTAAGTGGYLTIGGGTDAASAADAWAGNDCAFRTDASISVIPEGGFFFWASPTGGTVTNATADILCLGAVTQNQTCKIVIVGDHT